MVPVITKTTIHNFLIQPFFFNTDAEIYDAIYVRNVINKNYVHKCKKLKYI